MEPSGIPALEKTVLIHVRRTGQARIAGLGVAGEASLAAALMRGEPVTLARGTVIRLTRTLLIYTEEPKWGTGAFYGKKKEDFHCECRRERQSAGGACVAGCGGRAEGRRRCAQAWSARPPPSRRPAGPATRRGSRGRRARPRCTC